MVGGSQNCRSVFKAKSYTRLLVDRNQKNYEGDTVFPLHKLREWPYTILQEAPDFKIKHCLNPHSLRKEI